MMLATTQRAGDGGEDRPHEVKQMTNDSKQAHVVQAPLYPTYEHLACVLRSFDGEPVKRVRDTIKDIMDQTGTPQNPVDWSEPDIWINERLFGDSRTLAQKI
jgi:hypothetical protein